MTQNVIHIKATNLPDLWYQTLYKAIELGRDFTVDTGSYEGQRRKEFDFVILHSKCPGVGELLPKLNPALNLDDPCAPDFLDQYMPYIMTGEEQPGEAYTYGQRICKEFCENIKTNRYSTPTLNLLIPEERTIENESFIFEENCDFFLSQLELMIWTYKNKGFRNNQMILQVGKPTDMLLKDPPCLRHIDTRIQDGKLHFYPYFRSWDLWGGLPANLAAIEVMRQYCASSIGLETGDGEIVACSKGLHLYSYIWEIAEMIRGRTSAEFKAEMEDSKK